MPDNQNNFNPFNLSFDIEFLKKEVGKKFPYYEVKMGPNSVAFFCRLDENKLEENFNDLRKSLSEKDYIPMLKYEKGEHIIYILKKPKRKEKPIWVNYALMIATIITCSITGSILHMGEFDLYSVSNYMDVFLPENLFHPFVLTVIYKLFSYADSLAIIKKQKSIQ